MLIRLCVSVTLVLATLSLASCDNPKPSAVSLVLINGKIITVDAGFSVQQALAINKNRIVAVSDNASIKNLIGPNTRVIDLKQRTVIPGLIDNHLHLIRNIGHYGKELRLDAVATKAAALKLIKQRAEKLPSGKWVFVMGGWSEDQFTDSKTGFTRAELDKVAPDNPVLIKRSFSPGFANTRAFEAIGITADFDIPFSTYVNDIALGKDDKPTGLVKGAVLRKMQALLPKNDPGNLDIARQTLLAFNRVGLTAAIDVNGPDENKVFYPTLEKLDRQGRMTLRIFHSHAPEAIESNTKGQELYQELKNMQFGKGSDYLDRVGVGEIFFHPMHDSMVVTANADPQVIVRFKHYAQQVAQAGVHLHFHATHSQSIKQHLAVFESMKNKQAIRQQRWVFGHADGITKQQIARAKKLGMGLAIHSRPVVYAKVANRETLEMLVFGKPPLRDIQQSGILWGLGSDGTYVNVYNPFITLWWAVSGKMLGGEKISEQTVSRKHALIAHTLSNAKILKKEAVLGSLEVGKYADLLVLDRAYLTCAEDEIMQIKPLLTMVGGKIVYRSKDF